MNNKVLRKNIDFICTTKKGTNKTENEDAYLIIQEPAFSFFIVFDGVGSAKNARKATLLSKFFLKKNYKAYISEKVQLKELMFDLNNHLLDQSQEELFTTYNLLFISHNTDLIFFSSLGDSRLYKMNNQFLEQISIDDSYSANVITKCLGLKYYKESVFESTILHKGAFSFLLCTDGFYNLMEKDKIYYFEIFCKKRLSNTKDLLRKRIAGNNNDDATIIYIKNV